MIAQVVYQAAASLGWKEILAGALIIFNAGGLVYVMQNHLSSLKKDMREIKERLRKVEEDVSFLKGKVDS